MAIEALVRALLGEADAIDDLTRMIVEQREAIKSGNYPAMQEYMKSVQGAFFFVQTEDAARARLSDTLAKDLGCEPCLSSFCTSLSEAEATELQSAGERLSHSVFALKAEMVILSGLIEQNERFGAMLLSEWRRLEGGVMRAGGFDFRG